jgi:hypothetical protein
MSAPKGNSFWKMADPDKIGRPLEFSSPKELWTRACDYFQWCDDNPYYELKVFNNKGDVVQAEVPKMRAYTLKELCLHLGVNEAYFRQFDTKEKQEYSTVITRIRDVIYTQKFTGAAADLLNPNIIARELGLADRLSTHNITEFYVGEDDE